MRSFDLISQKIPFARILSAYHAWQADKDPDRQEMARAALADFCGVDGFIYPVSSLSGARIENAPEFVDPDLPGSRLAQAGGGAVQIAERVGRIAVPCLQRTAFMMGRELDGAGARELYHPHDFARSRVVFDGQHVIAPQRQHASGGRMGFHRLVGVIVVIEYGDNAAVLVAGAVLPPGHPFASRQAPDIEAGIGITLERLVNLPVAVADRDHAKGFAQSDPADAMPGPGCLAELLERCFKGLAGKPARGTEQALLQGGIADPVPLEQVGRFEARQGCPVADDRQA